MRRILVFYKKVHIVTLKLKPTESWKEVEQKAMQYGDIFGYNHLRIKRVDY